MMFADDVACWLLVLLPMMLPPQNLSSFLFFNQKLFPIVWKEQHLVKRDKWKEQHLVYSAWQTYKNLETRHWHPKNTQRLVAI